jgi:hypothetical protein
MAVAPRALFWVNVGLLATALLLALAGLAGAEPALLLAFVLFVILAFTAPAARWGAAGLLLTPGLLLALVGVLALAAGSIGGTLAAEVNEDNDGDGVANEDPPGDADSSESNPAAVNGLAEARNHADDDGDGRVDEDPAAPPGTRTALAAASTFGGLFLVLGVVAITAFLVFTRRRGKQAAGAPRQEPPAT